MPQLGETVAEGTVTNWYKQVGDTIAADEALFDVETDKVATEIPSPVAGVLAEVLVPAGSTVKVGTRLAVVRTADDRPPTAAMPVPAVSIAETAPATPAPVVTAAAAAPAGARQASGSDQQKLSPVVRRLLAEHGLAAGEIRGTGRDGRVTRDDLLAHIARKPASAVTAPAEATIAPAGPMRIEPRAERSAPVPIANPAAGVPQPAAAAPDAGLSEYSLPLNNIRRRSGAAMAQAWQVVPHVLQAVEADYSRIEAARRAKGAAWQAREGHALTYLPFLAWAVCQALTRYDQLNARLEGDSLIVSRRIHLGIAVDLDHDGLVVPVIRDAQDKTLPALAREIRRLAIGARASRLGPDDYAQPTYTISNSGVFGTLITAPIVNPPQVAILSTDGVGKRPVVVESELGDSIAIRPVGVLAQSFDHRAVDGAYSAAFLRELKRLVETRAWVEDLA